MDRCEHDLAEKETACADGKCPICLVLQLARLLKRMREAREELLTIQCAHPSEANRLRQMVDRLLKEESDDE